MASEEKTAIRLLQEACKERSLPQPIFIQRKQETDDSQCKIIIAINGVTYGSATEGNKTLACHSAAVQTLKILYGDEFTKLNIKPAEASPSTPPPLAISSPAFPTPPSTPAAPAVVAHVTCDTSNPQLNTVSMVNVLFSACRTTNTLPPEFKIFNSDAMFRCVLSVSIDGHSFDFEGQGTSKIIAKREACYSLLV